MGNSQRYRYFIFLLYTFTALLSLALFFFIEPRPLVFGVGDIPVFLLFFLHLFAGLGALGGNLTDNAGRQLSASAVEIAGSLRKKSGGRLLATGNGMAVDRGLFVYENLFAISLVVFLFTYIFALAANMDYVQRFIVTGGNLKIAVDTRTERAEVLLKYGLYLLVFPLMLTLRAAVYRAKANGGRGTGNKINVSTQSFLYMVLVLLSAVLHALSFPSSLSANGFGVLAWVSLIPLFFVLRKSQLSRFLFYGRLWISVTLLIRNYWLGTFNIVSFQVALIILVAYGLLFFLVLWLAELLIRHFEKKSPHSQVGHILLFVLIYSAIWTIFDWVQTQGFTAYPWTLMPHSQWRNTALVQLSSVTGMWGIGQLVYLVNGIGAAFFLLPPTRREHLKIPAFAVLGLVLLAQLGGAVSLLVNGPPQAKLRAFVELTPENTLLTSSAPNPADPASPAGSASASPPEPGFTRIALVQQNSDPRKHDYDATLDTLITLSEEVTNTVPGVDLVAWSETAFVPNITRWGATNQNPNHPLVRIVRRMLNYQQDLGSWLVTGNDDYTVTVNEDGSEERKSYNAAVLFSSAGERVETYHKTKLVPFTEYFPYQEQLPGIYSLLESFDVHFWEPGEEQTVFIHPEFSFSTPICFEDSFPNITRGFVRDGAEVILNLSNDYWSLTDVEAKQHFAASLFRAVENRRYLLRSTASGITTAVDPQGRVLFELPTFVPAAAVVDIPIIQDQKTTLYTRLGDYYIILLMLCLAACILWVAIASGSQYRRSQYHRFRPRLTRTIN